jgi:hypothetical protein
MVADNELARNVEKKEKQLQFAEQKMAAWSNG